MTSLDKKVTISSVKGVLDVVPSNGFRTGLLLGWPASSTMTIAKVIATPSLGTDGDDDGSSSNEHAEWMGVHADQVNRLLCGGVRIVGIYFQHNPSTPPPVALITVCVQHCQAVTNDSHDSVVLVRAAESTAGWRAFDQRMDTQLTHSSINHLSVMELTTRIATRFYVPVPPHQTTSNGGDDGVVGVDELVRAVQPFIDTTQRTCVARIVHNNTTIVVPSEGEEEERQQQQQTVDTLISSAKQQSSVAVDFLLPAPVVPVPSNDKLVMLDGSWCGVAYVPSKYPLQAALRELLRDCARSLLHRFRVMDDNYQFAFDGTSLSLRMNELMMIPRRVVFPMDTAANGGGGGGGVQFCDYMSVNESADDVANRVKELLGLEDIRADRIQTTWETNPQTLHEHAKAVASTHQSRLVVTAATATATTTTEREAVTTISIKQQQQQSSTPIPITYLIAALVVLTIGIGIILLQQQQ